MKRRGFQSIDLIPKCGTGIACFVNTFIDTGCVLRSLIEDIRNELGLPKPSEAAQ
jgi:hypothetical protein